MFLLLIFLWLWNKNTKDEMIIIITIKSNTLSEIRQFFIVMILFLLIRYDIYVCITVSNLQNLFQK